MVKRRLLSSDGIITFPRENRPEYGWRLQFYWPIFELAIARKLSKDFIEQGFTQTKPYLEIGASFKTVFRFCINKNNTNYFCLGFQIFGFGAGIEYMEKENKPAIAQT